MGQRSGMRQGIPLKLTFLSEPCFLPFIGNVLRKAHLPCQCLGPSSTHVQNIASSKGSCAHSAGHKRQHRAQGMGQSVSPLCLQRCRGTEPSLCSCPGVMLETTWAGVWQHKRKSLRHLEDRHEEDRSTGISTSVLELRSRAFAVWAPWSHLAIQNLFCHIAAWAFGERRLRVMNLQLSWVFTSLCTTSGNTLCTAAPLPRTQLHPPCLPQSFLFQMVCVLELLLILKEK